MAPGHLTPLGGPVLLLFGAGSHAISKTRDAFLSALSLALHFQALTANAATGGGQASRQKGKAHVQSYRASDHSDGAEAGQG
jgi:hypothetical protein